jgi:hypothetical protein
MIGLLSFPIIQSSYPPRAQRAAYPPPRPRAARRAERYHSLASQTAAR